MKHEIIQILKYVIYGAVIYLLFSKIPQNSLHRNEIIAVVTIITTSYILMDKLCPSENITEDFDIQVDNENIVSQVNTSGNINIDGNTDINIEVDDMDDDDDDEEVPVVETIAEPVIDDESDDDDDGNDMKYSELPAAMHRPLGEPDETANGKFHNFSYLNTNRWTVPYPQPPVCIQAKKCPVCPVTSDGSAINLMQVGKSRNVSKRNLNVKYITERYNN